MWPIRGRAPGEGMVFGLFALNGEYNFKRVNRVAQLYCRRSPKPGAINFHVLESRRFHKQFIFRAISARISNMSYLS